MLIDMYLSVVAAVLCCAALYCAVLYELCWATVQLVKREGETLPGITGSGKVRGEEGGDGEDADGDRDGDRDGDGDGMGWRSRRRSRREGGRVLSGSTQDESIVLRCLIHG